MKRYRRKIQYDEKNIDLTSLYTLAEELRLSDLMKSSGMSDFTRQWAKKRGAVKGREVNLTKFIDLKINESQDYVEVKFITEPTYKFNVQTTKPSSGFSLKKDNLYTITIRFLDFFKLLGTNPKDVTEITNKDIEEVFENCYIQVHCDCPSFYWMGMAANLSMFDASVYHVTIPPVYWNKYHGGDQFLCKHSGRLINTIKFYIPQIRMAIKKKLGLTK